MGSNPTPSAKIPHKFLFSQCFRCGPDNYAQSKVQSIVSGLRLTQAMPFYMIGLMLDFARPGLGDRLGRLAARIAGDDWPE